MRSTAGLGLVAMRLRRGILAHPAARPLAATAVAVELLLDKMPFTGSRLRPEGIAGRLVFAGVAAYVCTSQEEAEVLPAALCVTLAVVSSVGSAKIAHDVRARLAARYPDKVVGALEDVAALSIAAAAMSI